MQKYTKEQIMQAQWQQQPSQKQIEILQRQVKLYKQSSPQVPKVLSNSSDVYQLHLSRDKNQQVAKTTPKKQQSELTVQQDIFTFQVSNNKKNKIIETLGNENQNAQAI